MTKRPESKLTLMERIAARRAAVGSRKPATPEEIAEIRAIYGTKPIPCPQCGELKLPFEGFGIRRKQNRDRIDITIQGKCISCRSAESKDYYSAPRVYRTKKR